VDSNQIVEASKGVSKHSIANAYVNKVLLFCIFYTFANISKNLFSLCHYGLFCVDCEGKKRFNKF
jgi:hypothetical protein